MKLTADGASIYTEGTPNVLAQVYTAGRYTQATCEDIAQRLAVYWNACADIPPEAFAAGAKVWTGDDVRRIHVLLTACAGIPTEALEAGALEQDAKRIAEACREGEEAAERLAKLEGK